MPWSPAPVESNGSRSPVPRDSIASSTPIAMSADCSSIDTETPHVAASNPTDEWL